MKRSFKVNTLPLPLIFQKEHKTTTRQTHPNSVGRSRTLACLCCQSLTAKSSLMFISGNCLLLCFISLAGNRTELNVVGISWQQLLPDHCVLGLCTDVEHTSAQHRPRETLTKGERTATRFSPVTPSTQMEHALSFSLYRAAFNCLPGQGNTGPCKAQIAWRRQPDNKCPSCSVMHTDAREADACSSVS